MASPSIPRVKRALRGFTRQRAQELAAKVIALEDPQQVHLLLDFAIEQAGLGTSLKLGPPRTSVLLNVALQYTGFFVD